MDPIIWFFAPQEFMETLGWLIPFVLGTASIITAIIFPLKEAGIINTMDPIQDTTDDDGIWPEDKDKRSLPNFAHAGIRVNMNCNAPNCVTPQMLAEQRATLKCNVSESGCRWTWAGTEKGGMCTGIENLVVATDASGAVTVKARKGGVPGGWLVGDGPIDGTIFRAQWSTELSKEEKMHYEKLIERRIAERGSEGIEDVD